MISTTWKNNGINDGDEGKCLICFKEDLLR